MLNMITLVVAFTLANITTAIIAMVAISDKRFMKFYYKKIIDMMKTMDEVSDEILKEEEGL